MTPEERLLRALQAQFGPRCRCRIVQGGWVIEVVSSQVTNQNRKVMLQQALHAVDRTFTQGGKTVWKVFLYRHSGDRFSVNGTLHTLPASWQGVSLLVLVTVTYLFRNLTVKFCNLPKSQGR
jgi:hypothetical protein